MKKHRIVIPLKVEIIMELLKGKRLIFNDKVEIIPEVEGKEEKYRLLERLQNFKYIASPESLFSELEKQMGIAKEEIKIFDKIRNR